MIFTSFDVSKEKPRMVKDYIEKGYKGWSEIEIFVGGELVIFFHNIQLACC